MSDTPHLGLPLLAPSQAQKHVTLNEALMALDAIVQLAVIDRGTNAPPPSSTDGDRHIVGSAPTGDWAGQADAVAVRLDGLWRFFAPRPGWTAFVEAEGRLVTWQNAAWTTGEAVFDRLGINAGADAYNRFVAALSAALFTDEGAGLQMKLNKSNAGDTASLVFQTGYGGRAEFGLVAGDDMVLKVSPDGATWTTILTVLAATATARFETPLRLASYVRASLPSTATAGAGAIAHVSDGAGNRRLAVCDGADWRWPDGTIVS